MKNPFKKPKKTARSAKTAPQESVPQEAAPIEPDVPKDVDAIVTREFTSTIFGNLVVGQKITISEERFEAWKASGMVKAAD